MIVMPKMKRTAVCLVIGTALLVASRTDAARQPNAHLLKEIASPARPESGEPNLSATSDGRLIASWIERRDEDAAVMMAIRQNERWSEPHTIVSGKNLIVNWADFPSVVAGSTGTLFAHWLQKNGSGTYAYEIRVARSRDDGKTWSASSVLHDDGTATEHGFVSLTPDTRGGVAAVWLDGRKMKPGEESGEMTLRYARLTPEGARVADAELDTRTCECCQTGMALTSGGPIIVYRDRTPSEIRDIFLVRWEGKRWSSPRAVANDGWKTDGCPVNGPQIDARGNKVVVAWFTGAAEKARVKIAFSADGGRKFSSPIQVDQGSPLGRVDVVMFPDGSAQVTWLERTSAGGSVLTRRVHPGGQMTSPASVGVTTAARAAGFPRTAIVNGTVYFAWTETGETPRIRMSELTGSR